MHFAKCLKSPGRPREGNQTLGFSAMSIEFYVILLADLM